MHVIVFDMGMQISKFVVGTVWQLMPQVLMISNDDVSVKTQNMRCPGIVDVYVVCCYFTIIDEYYFLCQLPKGLNFETPNSRDITRTNWIYFGLDKHSWDA